MSRPVSRRRLVASVGTVLVAAALPTGGVAALATETPSSGPILPTTFDAVAFLADLKAAGCDVLLSTPGTCFEPGDEVSTYFIRPGPGYCAVITRWHEAMEACSDHVGQVVVLLAERRGIDL